MWMVKSNCNTATLQRFWHSKKYKIFFCLIIREPQWRGGIFAVDSELGRISEGNTAFLAQREAVSPTVRGRNSEIGKKELF